MRELLASLLVALLAAPAAPPPLRPARVAGTVTVDGRALSGIGLALVDVESGAVHRATSAAGGSWSADLPPGRYALAAEGASGLAVVRGPALLALGSGQLARADLALALVPLGEQPAAASGKLTLEVDPVGCPARGPAPAHPRARAAGRGRGPGAGLLQERAGLGLLLRPGRPRGGRVRGQAAGPQARGQPGHDLRQGHQHHRRERAVARDAGPGGRAPRPSARLAWRPWGRRAAWRCSRPPPARP